MAKEEKLKMLQVHESTHKLAVKKAKQAGISIRAYIPYLLGDTKSMNVSLETKIYDRLIKQSEQALITPEQYISQMLTQCESEAGVNVKGTR